MKTKVIQSFDEYVKYTESYKNKYYFRGQVNSCWDIQPSIFREKNKSFYQKEHELITIEMMDSKLDAISTTLKLQHYGTPTRICDLTISTLGALFFAVDGDDNINNDGVVYVLDKSNAFIATSEELKIFFKVLLNNIACLTDSEKEIISKNYIIKYNIQFSYTNPRAIMQGGTGLLFGFEFVENGNKIQSKYGIKNYIYEKIIVPASVKKDIIVTLHKIGYSKEILYGNFENLAYTETVTLTETDAHIEQKGYFVKYSAKYKVSSIYFDRDKLTKEIENTYSLLLHEHGANARIWLFLFFDEHDLQHINWICRTTWNEENIYSVVWTKNYYSERLRIMNEEDRKSVV